MATPARWRDALTLGLGIGLLLAPLLFDFVGEPRAAWHAVGGGAMLFAIGAAAFNQHRSWEEYALLGLGLWLLGAPFLLGFAREAAVWAHVAVGALLTVDILWTLAADLRGRGGHRHA